MVPMYHVIPQRCQQEVTSSPFKGKWLTKLYIYICKESALLHSYNGKAEESEKSFEGAVASGRHPTDCAFVTSVSFFGVHFGLCPVPV